MSSMPSLCRLVLIISMASCACTLGAAPPEPTVLPAAEGAQRWAPALVEAVPHVRQRPDFCGEACVAMAMQGLGHDVDQDMVFAASGVDPALGRGVWTPELKRAVEHLGFDPGPVWERLDHEPTQEDLDRSWTAMHADLVRGVPSIVCMHYAEGPGSSEHFRLVLGYDPVTDELLYHEPAEDDGAWQRMNRPKFQQLWPLHGREDWTLIRLRLDPKELRPPIRTEQHSAGDFAQHVRALQSLLPDGFTVVVEPPFVVVGDEPAAVVQGRASKTVRTYAKAMEQDFFERQPGSIFTVWLFQDANSYYHHAKELWGEEPDTPYGYASETHKALVMNIATGGGTLVHEMVHPYVHADFPDCPQWLNEGLASLFEHVSMVDGHITGHTNWRLSGLQKAIEHDMVPSFEWLMERSYDQFYREDPGTNYAQSRYLCQYLQEKGVLRAYYRQVKANQRRDPTGWKTLVALLDIDDEAIFMAEWQAWVMSLEKP